MKILNGRALATEIKNNIKTEIQKLGTSPGLAVILVGNDPASHLYVNLKEKACAEVGIYFEKFLFPENINQETVIKKIQELNNQQNINGILVQLPLPENLDENKIIESMNFKKDADGFHSKNISLLLNNQPLVIPGVASGIVELIKSSGTLLSGKKATLLVNSQIFATPIEFLLKKLDVTAETIIAPPDLQTIKNKIQETDILIAAIGRPRALTSEFIKDNAILIDVGTNRLPDGKLVGDIDFESIKEKTGWITPVPGGVGPMTVAMLLKNVFDLARNNR